MTRLTISALLAALALTVSTGVQAQLYHYKDASGKMVYSDTPPPPGTPPANILKAPKVNQASPAPAPAGDDKAAPKSTAEREADYKKRQAEGDKKAKEDAQKVQADAARQQACQSAQSNLAALQSGQRMRKFDTDGSSRFIDDNERAADVQKAQKIMGDNKCG